MRQTRPERRRGGWKNPRAEIRELKAALGKAIATYSYASMTTWEHEACAADMEFAEAIANKYGVANG